MDKLKWYFWFLRGKFRRIFFMSVPESEQEYENSRNKYIVVETSGMIISELANGTFVVAVLNYIHMSDSISGITRSLGSLVALFQLLTMKYVQKMRKHKLFVCFCVLQKLWLGVVFFIPSVNCSNMMKCFIVVIIYLVAQIVGQLGNPSAINWIASLVPPKTREIYLSKKDSIATFITFLVMLCAGILFDATKGENVLQGFQMMGFLLIVISVVNTLAFVGMKEPKISYTNEDGKELQGTLAKKRMEKEIHKNDFSIWNEVKETFGLRAFRKIFILNSLWTMAVYIANPFNASYQIKELRLSYTYIMIIGFVTMLLRVFLMPKMGKFANKIGNEPVLTFVMMVMGIYYLCMIFTVPSNGNILFLIASIFSAIAWSFINSGMFGIQLKHLEEEKRTIQYTILSALSGIVGFVTSILAGKILSILQKTEILILNQKIYAQQIMNSLGLIGIVCVILYLICEFQALDKLFKGTARLSRKVRR